MGTRRNSLETVKGHRVTVSPSPRRVRVVVGGETVADTRRALELHETGLPVRWYLPREDVRAEVLEPSDRQTRCPFKGTASYFSVRAGGELHRDVIWSYEAPIPEVAEIAGHLAFYDDRVSIQVD